MATRRKPLYLVLIPPGAAPEVFNFDSERAAVRLICQHFDWLIDDDRPPRTLADALALVRSDKAGNVEAYTVRNRGDLDAVLCRDRSDWLAVQSAVARIAEREGWPLPVERVV